MLSVMKTKKKKLVLRNKIILLLDRSGSMDHLWSTVAKVFDQTVNVIKQSSIDEKQPTDLSLISFGNYVTQDFAMLPVETVKPFYSYRLTAGGSTPLLAAVNKATTQILYSPDFQDKNVSFLIKVLTDGEATDKSTSLINSILQELKELNDSGRVTVVFEVPPGGKSVIKNLFNNEIPDDNIQEWETTSQGLETVSAASSIGLQGYFVGRSSGATRSTNFYVDASKLTKSEVKKAGFKDISSKVRSYLVMKEEPIKEFIERKTRKDYLVGMAYYKLTKAEKLQARKLFLLKEIGKSEVYAGLDARTLLGLPETGDVKITPGILGKWEIFVQSTSVNRKLVRGTSVLYLG